LTVSFDAATRRQLDEALEVRIETLRPDGSTRRTIIWVVVDGEDVFLRSVRGDRGHWFQAATDAHEPLTMIVGKQPISVTAHLAADPDSIARCSRALERKYADDPALPSMLRPMTLATTLRIEPA
jgi:hypothetical protein